MRRRGPNLLQRHDLGVLIVAAAILVGGALLHRSLVAPKFVSFASEGLRFERPGGWLSTQAKKPQVSPLVQGTAEFGADDGTSTQPHDSPGLHNIFVSPVAPRQRIEVRIVERPTYSNLRGALAVQRLGQYGEFYWARSSGNAAIARRDWLRTEYRYAFKPSKSGSPQIAEAVEYAIVNDGRLYIVTLHDSPENLQVLDALIAGSLRIAATQNNSVIKEDNSQ